MMKTQSWLITYSCVSSILGVRKVPPLKKKDIEHLHSLVIDTKLLQASYLLG